MFFGLDSTCPETCLGFCYVWLTCANMIKLYHILPTPMLAFFLLFDFNMLGLNREVPEFLLQVTGWFISQKCLYHFYQKEKKWKKKCFGITFRHSLSSPLPACNCLPKPLKSFPSQAHIFHTAQPKGRQEELIWLILYRMRIKGNGTCVYLRVWVSMYA